MTLLNSNRFESVVRYHELSKHGFHAFAPGPGRLDWANQPNPFRRYEGAELVPLQKSKLSGPLEEPHYETALLTSEVTSTPVTFGSISQLFFDSLALSAWKSIQGSKWSLRVNPSSGNLHPTEGYVIAGPVKALSETPFVGHYAPLDHLLEVRTRFSMTLWSKWLSNYPEGTFFFGLSSIYWREAWKYGARAFRYCQHDVGHAIASVSFAAAAQGWTVRLMDHWSDEELRLLLGLSKGSYPAPIEEEHPDCLLAIIPTQLKDGITIEAPLLEKEQVLPEFRMLAQQGSWQGHPNQLSLHHRNWPQIDEVAQACEKPQISPPLRGDRAAYFRSNEGGAVSHSEPQSLRKLIHQRRSAVDFDGQYGISKESFYQLLRKLVPAEIRSPFNSLPWEPQVNLGFFVHRVKGLDPGLYLLVRNAEHEAELRTLMTSDFVWEKPEGCPLELSFWRLATGDVRGLAMQVSCGQNIAGESAFSLGMISRFEEPLRNFGSWFYTRLYWECGVIGQALYLEAEAMGIRGTGIGCFFDDPVHDTFGLKDRAYQSLYHFTVGVPVEDSRLMVTPGYSL